MIRIDFLALGLPYTWQFGLSILRFVSLILHLQYYPFSFRHLLCSYRGIPVHVCAYTLNATHSVVFEPLVLQSLQFCKVDFCDCGIRTLIRRFIIFGLLDTIVLLDRSLLTIPFQNAKHIHSRVVMHCILL